MYSKAIALLKGSFNEDEYVDAINDAVSNTTTNGYKQSDSVLELIGLVLLLIMILCAAYYTTRFVGRIKLGKLKESNFKVIDTYRISQNRALQIVKVANRYIVIAIGKDTVNYIMELQEQDVQKFETDQGDKQNFTQIFETLKKKKVKVGNHEDKDRTFKE